MNASENGHRDVVQLLLGKGADVNAKNNGGKTALTYASGRGHQEVKDLLIKAGAK
ncbi:MAG: ankyrin repeat domain-containing protein [Syntrophobacteraceae bacterium]